MISVWIRLLLPPARIFRGDIADPCHVDTWKFSPLQKNSISQSVILFPSLPTADHGTSPAEIVAYCNIGVGGALLSDWSMKEIF